MLTARSPTSTSQSVHLNWSQHCNAVGTFNASWCALCKKQSRSTRDEEQLGGMKKKEGWKGRWGGERRVMWGCASTRNQISKRLKKKKQGGVEYLPGRRCRIAPCAIQPVEQSLHSSPPRKRSCASEPIKKFGN